MGPRRPTKQETHILFKIKNHLLSNLRPINTLCVRLGEMKLISKISDCQEK